MPKKVLFVVPFHDFRDEELFHTMEELKNAGIELDFASAYTGTAKGMLGGTCNISKKIDEVNVKDFDAIVFVGGSGAEAFFDNRAALALAKEFYLSKKVVAAICIAPVILANAGILVGKKATVFESEKETLEGKGAVLVPEYVVCDGKIVTAKGPKSAHDFGKKIAELLKN